MIGTGKDPVADSYDGSRIWPHSAMESFLAGLKFLLGSGPALEVGVGRGRIAGPLLERDVQIVGLDISAHELTGLARQHVPESNPDIDLAQGNAISLPFADASFIGVYTVNVFHQIKQWEQGLVEIQRVLMAG